MHKNSLKRKISRSNGGNKVFAQIPRLDFTACLRISAKRKIVERPSVNLTINFLLGGNLLETESYGKEKFSSKKKFTNLEPELEEFQGEKCWT